MQKENIFISIIIVNYNTFSVTCNCIETIVKYTKGVEYEIIVVDNASPNDNPADFLKQFPQINLIVCSENAGFAKGNNVGIAAAKGNIILLLNSDTLLREDSISIAAGYLAEHSGGPLTVHLIYEDGKYQHNARAFRSIRNEILDIFRPLLLFIPYSSRAVLMLNQYFDGDFDTKCDWISGAFFMFKRSLLEIMPDKCLDNRFFMYGEDQLWCYQFKAGGYPSYFLSITKVVHIANASTEPAKQLKLLKTFIDRELDIIAYRKGKSWYYYIFKLIFVPKEMVKYYIKLFSLRIFNFRVR